MRFAQGLAQLVSGLLSSPDVCLYFFLEENPSVNGGIYSPIQSGPEFPRGGVTKSNPAQYETMPLISPHVSPQQARLTMLSSGEGGSR